MALIGRADLDRYAIPALGLGVAQWADSAILNPIVGKMIPTGGSGPMAGLVDAGLTYVAAVGVGKAVGLASKKVGDDLEFGGKILAWGKVLLAFLPHYYQISANLTLPFGPQPQGAMASANPKALPSSQQAAATATTAGQAYGGVSALNL